MLLADNPLRRVRVNSVLMNESRHIFNLDEKVLGKIYRLLPGNDILFEYNEIIYRVWKHMLVPDGSNSGHLFMISFPDNKQTASRYRIDITEKLGKYLTIEGILQLANILQIAEIHDI